MAVDPVCGMQVDESTAAATYEYQGTTYYFCAPGCKSTFERNPEQFLSQDPSPAHHEHKHGHHHGGCGCGCH